MTSYEYNCEWNQYNELNRAESRPVRDGITLKIKMFAEGYAPRARWALGTHPSWDTPPSPRQTS